MKTKFTMASGLIALIAVAPANASTVSEKFKLVKDSVVVIETVSKEVDRNSSRGLVSVGGIGSGVLISNEGMIMTAAHVIQTAERIRVHFNNGEMIDARVSASMTAADLALIQLEKMPADYQVAELGDSDSVEVGDQIFVVGAPFGISHTLTVGHISARREDTSVFGGLEPTELFQTDAAINKGNSGGPMFDLNGKVIGIVSYIISQSGGFEGLGFVVTARTAQQVLLDERSLWTGFCGQLLTDEMAALFNLPQKAGMLVETVADRSPAVHMGLQGGDIRATIGDTELILGGDIVLDILGVPLSAEKSYVEIRKRAQALKVNDEIILRVLRGGKIVELKSTFIPNLFYPATAEAR